MLAGRGVLRLVALGAFLGGMGLAQAQDKKKPAPDTGISYAKQVYPILNDRCQPCHYAKDKKGGLDVSTYAALMKGGKSPKCIVPGQPESSLLIKDIVGKDPPMPKNANPLTEPQIDLITRWIKEGARNN
ncbi:MAG TPA: c-type cytochrome domain-containing protein [Planctomycetota bacterium]|nr:c-type cytochrome domain-containing protein [Planctomycetota bacterium]